MSETNTPAQAPLTQAAPAQTAGAPAPQTAPAAPPQETAEQTPQTPPDAKEAKEKKPRAMRPDQLLEEDEPEESADKRAKRDRVFLNNPVIMQGLGLAPLIVTATTLKNGLLLSVAVLLLLTPTRVVAAMLSRFSYFRFRGLTYALTSATVYIGARLLMGMMFTPADLALLGIYLPLLVADPIVLKRYERPQRERVRTALRKGLITSVGYILALLIISALREIVGAGTLMGVQVVGYAVFPMAQLPSGGFVITALIMGVWRAAAAAVRNQMRLGAEQP